MIQKIKENQYVKLVHELLQNPRTRGIVKLVLWLLFFAFIFALFDVRGGNKTVESEYTSLDKWRNEKNYRYNITFEIDDEAYMIDGVRNGTNEKFRLAEEIYYIESEFVYMLKNYDKVFISEPVIFDYNPLKLRPEFLNQVLTNGKLEYTTNYENGMVKKSYSVNTAKFVELYKELVISDDSTVTIDMTEQNGVIVEVDLNLSEFMKYNINKPKKYQIKIEYRDFGDVTVEEVE